jgi:hypothetical protein
LKQIQVGLELFRSDQGRYPQPPGDKVENCGDTLAYPCDTDQTVTYLKTVPTDPSTGNDYFYDSDGSTYTIYGCSENAKTGSDVIMATDPSLPSGLKSAIDCKYYFYYSNP